MNCTTPLDQQPIHLKLPIAPRANHRLGPAPDKKIKPAMLPIEAVSWIRALRKGGKTFKVIELCGPGDSLASAEATVATLKLLQPEIGDAELSLTCLGLGATAHAGELSRLGVTKINLLVDTIQPATAAKLYAWIRPGKKTLPMARAAELLIADQAEAVTALSSAGMTVVIRSTVYQDINDTEIGIIAEKMAALGATEMELDVGEGENSLIEQASTHLPTSRSNKHSDLLPPGTPQPGNPTSLPKPSKEKPNVAVVSSNGMDVDIHMGQAAQILIYGPRDDGLACLLESRPTPPAGTPERWKNLADILHDCFALLVSHAGDTPRKVLAERDIKVIFTEDNVEGLVDVLFGDGKNGKCKK